MRPHEYMFQNFFWHNFPANNSEDELISFADSTQEDSLDILVYLSSKIAISIAPPPTLTNEETRN